LVRILWSTVLWYVYLDLSLHCLHPQSGQSWHSPHDLLQCCSHPQISQMNSIIYLSSVLPRSFLSWQGVGSNIQPNTVLIALRLPIVSISVGTVFTFGLAQLVAPIPIKINVSSIIIFLSMSLLTIVFTTGRCVYLACVYDDVFWKPSATLPAFGPDLITYFCVPLAPVFTSVRRCLCRSFSLDALCCLAIASFIAFESLIIILYTIFMHCQQG
jgi:hypothetical protein